MDREKTAAFVEEMQINMKMEQCCLIYLLFFLCQVALASTEMEFLRMLGYHFSLSYCQWLLAVRIFMACSVL